MIIPWTPAVRGKAEEVQAVLTDGLLQGVDLLQLLVVGALLQASLQQLRLLALQVVLLLHLLIPGGGSHVTRRLLYSTGRVPIAFLIQTGLQKSTCSCSYLGGHTSQAGFPDDFFFLPDILFYIHLFIIIIINNFCLALFSGVPKLTVLYNILQHFLSFTNIIHIIMTTNNV